MPKLRRSLRKLHADLGFSKQYGAQIDHPAVLLFLGGLVLQQELLSAFHLRREGDQGAVSIDDQCVGSFLKRMMILCLSLDEHRHMEKHTLAAPPLRLRPGLGGPLVHDTYARLAARFAASGLGPNPVNE